MIEKLKDTASQILKSSTITPLYDAVGGLSEFWALIFGSFGVYLALRGRLDGNYAVMVTAVTGILTAHEAMDDYHSRHKHDGDSGRNG